MTRPQPKPNRIPREETGVKDPIYLASYRKASTGTVEKTAAEKPAGLPSNEVHARVGDDVLPTAMEGARRAWKTEETIADIRKRHGTRLKMSELRLRLASRSVANRP